MRNPDLEPIASDIGHGRLGLRSGLRRFSALTRESSCQKQVFVDAHGAKLLASGGWSVHSGSVYKITVNEVHRGRRMDVVAVRAGYNTLTRSEVLASLPAGHYFFDADAGVASQLYVRLPDSSNPASEGMLALFGFYFANLRAVQPVMGEDKLTDGALDIWTNPTTLTNWLFSTGIGSSGASVNKDASVLAKAGGFSARIKVGSLVQGATSFISLSNDAAAMPTVAGAMYRLEGSYQTDPLNSGGLVAGVGLQGTGGMNICEDGRSINILTSQRLPLLPANGLLPVHGEFRDFIFDVVAPSTALFTRLYALCRSGGTGAGRIWFDNLTIRRIWTWEEYENRFALDAVPKIDEGRRGPFFERWTTGNGTLSLVNDDDLEELFGAYGFTSSKVMVRVGGRFENGGNEILTENMWTRRWTARKVTVDSEKAVLDLDDPRQIFDVPLPNRYLDDFPAVAKADKGRPSALLFGDNLDHIKPPRVDVSGTTGFGIRQLLDPEYQVQTASLPISEVMAYTSEEAADKELATERLDATGIISVDAPDGEIGFVEDIRPIRIEAGKNDLLAFNEGAGALVAKIGPGLYYPAELVASIVPSALSAVGGTYSGNYDNATHKATITQTAPLTTFQILLDSAAVNRDRSAWPSIGFTGNTNRTGALSYLGNDALFTDLDKQHVIRVIADGYLDDSSGTYTGTPGARIELPGDILYFLLRKVLGVPVEQIDLTSVAAARAGAAALKVYLGAPGDEVHDFGQIVEWIENSAGVELLVDGERFVMRQRSNAVPNGALVITDSDLLSEIVGGYDEASLASIVKIEGNQDAGNGKLRLTSTTSDASARARLGRDRSRTFRTYCPALNAWTSGLITNAVTPRRWFRAEVQSVALTQITGDLVVLAASRFLGRSDSFPSVTCRITHATHPPDSWISTLDLSEVLSISGGW